MANIVAIANGFDVTGARAIVAHLTLSSDKGRCAFRIDYGAAGTTYKCITGSLTRVLPGGAVQAAPVFLQDACGVVTLPPGAFPGRNVSYRVAAGIAGFRLQVTVDALDGGSVNEVWLQECSIIDGPKDFTNFKVAVTTPGTTTCGSVEIVA